MWVWFLLVLAPLVHSLEWYQEGNPTFLNHNNATAALQDPHCIKVLKFFSPSCGYCRYLKRYFQQYKSSSQVSPNMKFYDINCNDQESAELCARYSVYAFPVVYFLDEARQVIGQMGGLYPMPVVFQMLGEFNLKAQKLQSVVNKLDEEPLPEKDMGTQHESIDKQQSAAAEQNKAESENNKQQLRNENSQTSQINDVKAQSLKNEADSEAKTLEEQQIGKKEPQNTSGNIVGDQVPEDNGRKQNEYIRFGILVIGVMAALIYSLKGGKEVEGRAGVGQAEEFMSEEGSELDK